MRWFLLVLLAVSCGAPVYGGGGDEPPWDGGPTEDAGVLACETHDECPAPEGRCPYCSDGECFVVGCPTGSDAGEPDAGDELDAGQEGHAVWPTTELGDVDARDGTCPDGVTATPAELCAHLEVECGRVLTPTCYPQAAVECSCPGNGDALCRRDFTCGCWHPSDADRMGLEAWCRRDEPDPDEWSCGARNTKDACGRQRDISCGDCPDGYVCGVNTCDPEAQ